MKNKILKRIFEVLFFFAVMGFSFYTIFKGQDLQKIWAEITTMSVPHLLFAILMSVLYVSFEGIMICFLLHSIDNTCKIHDCLKYSFVCFFYSAITPSASGGQPMQLYYMTKDGHQFNQSFVVLMIVATLNKIVLVVLGLGLIIFANPILMAYLGKYRTLFYIGLGIDFIWVLILVALMAFTEPLRKLINRLIHFFLKRHPKRVEKLEASINSFFSGYQDSLSFIVKNPVKIGITTLLSFVQRACPILITFLVYRGLGMTEASPATILVLQAAIYVTVDMLPIPGAQGITELMYRHVYMLIIPAQSIMSSMYVTRGVNFYLLLAIGGITSLVCFIYYKNKSKKEAAVVASSEPQITAAQSEPDKE